MITTPFTDMFQISHPIALGPMGGVAGGRLAAAVSNAGGLGLVGGGYGDPAWLDAELRQVQQGTSQPWGVGFITWHMSDEAFQLGLDARPAAIVLSFGDPRPYAERVKRVGSKLICQVQDVAGALLAKEAGADLIVAQGTEGGGHGGSRGTFPLTPAVVDVAGGIPVLTAGGVGDGRGLAAALMLGAQGVLVGTRFYASTEALGHDEAKGRIAQADGDHTQRTRVFDIVRGYDWPNGYTGRALDNAFMRRWHGHEGQLAEQAEAQAPAFWAAAGDGDYDTAMVWAGEAVDLINHVQSAGEIIEQMVDQAQAQLRRAASLCGHTAAQGSAGQV